MGNDSFLSWKDKVYMMPQKETSLPIDWKIKFPDMEQLMVEIGFGNGTFLKELAVDKPKNLVVGFDISMESCVKAIKICRDNDVNNIRIIQNHAFHMLRELFPDNSIRKIYMNFPDPWPKKKHRAKRTISEAFINVIGAVLEMNGAFELVTDQGWYAEESKELLEKSPFFSVKEFQVDPQRKFQTKYEKKWLALKRNVFRLLVEKTASHSISRLYKGEEMPHVNLKISLTEEKIISELKNLEKRGKNHLFKIKEIYKKDASDRFLLKIISVDGDQQQKFFIAIQKRDTGWLIKLDDLTQPFRTPAVKFAVFEIGRILQNTAESSKN